MKSKNFLKISLIFLLILIKPAMILSKNLHSPSYKIQFGNINIGGKPSQSSNYNLTTTLGQTAAQEFQSNGYIVKAGFQYIYARIPFRFSLSKTQIDFGNLLPNSPKTDQILITVSFGQAGEYQVSVGEIGPLRTFDETNFIPDTQCDGGINTCTENSAKPWISTFSYGFGYNMAGQDIPTDFINSDYYRPFSNLLNNEEPTIIMTSTNVGKNKQATMTLKVNISSTQPAGKYQTILLFSAITKY